MSGSGRKQPIFYAALRETLLPLLEEKGWTTFERFSGGKRLWYYCKPGIRYQKGAGYRNGAHFFDSVRGLVAFLKSDDGGEFFPRERLEDLELDAAAAVSFKVSKSARSSPTARESSPDRGGSGSLSVEVKFSRALRDSLKLELEKKGWTFHYARGRRNKSDWYYCKPGIQYNKKGYKMIGAGYKRNVHYFTSLRRLVAFLKSDEGSEFVPPERLEGLERGARAVAEAVSADDGADSPPQEEGGETPAPPASRSLGWRSGGPPPPGDRGRDGGAVLDEAEGGEAAPDEVEDGGAAPDEAGDGGAAPDEAGDGGAAPDASGGAGRDDAGGPRAAAPPGRARAARVRAPAAPGGGGGPRAGRTGTAALAGVLSATPGPRAGGGGGSYPAASARTAAAVGPGPRRGDGDRNALGAAAAGMSYRRMLLRDWLRSLDAKDGRDNRMEAYAPAFEREFSDTDQVARASSMCGAKAILKKCEVKCIGDRVDLSLAISHLASSFAERPTVNLTNNAEPEEDRMRARRGRKRIKREEIIELSSDEAEAEAEVVGDLERERAHHGRKRAKAIEILSSDDDD